MKKINIKKTSEVIYYKKLENGLDIYMLPNDKVKNFYITLSTHYGSIHTNFKLGEKNHSQPKGIAHFLEHLLFNMPDNVNVFDYYSSIGSSINAFTSYDITCYEVFANQMFKENLSYLLEYVYTPYFTKEMVEGEKGIITEEIKMIQDNPNSEIFYGMMRNLFVRDERQYLISGTIEDIKKITLKDIETAYEAFYHPENMFLIITGNFKPEQAVAIISESLKDFAFPKYSKPIISEVKEPLKVKNELEEKLMPVDKHKVAVGLKIPKANFKSLKLSDLELKMYLNLIFKVNFGPTSILKEELASNGVIIGGIGNFVITVDDYMISAFNVTTDYPDYFLKRFKEEIKKMEFDQEELDRKLKCALSNMIMSFDNIETVNSDIQDDILNYKEYIHDIADYYDKLSVGVAKKVISKLGKYSTSITILEPKEDEI